MTDKQTLDFYNKNVENYKKLITEMPDHKDLEKFVSLIPKASKILDFGCGIGNFANFMKQNGLNVFCIDGSKEMAHAANKFYNLNVTVMTFNEFNTLNYYDAIWANFSLLHCLKEDFRHVINSINLSLRKNGVFYISLKIGAGENRDSLGRHYAYFKEDEIEKILVESNFKIFNKSFGSNVGMVGEKEPWIGIFCKK